MDLGVIRRNPQPHNTPPARSDRRGLATKPEAPDDRAGQAPPVPSETQEITGGRYQTIDLLQANHRNFLDTIPVGVKKRRVQATALWIHQSLPPRKGKTQSANTFSPNIKIGTGRTKNNIVTVDFDRNVARDEEAKSEVILQAQKREWQKIAH
jgi:hypothetical protein